MTTKNSRYRTAELPRVVLPRRAAASEDVVATVPRRAAA